MTVSSDEIEEALYEAGYTPDETIRLRYSGRYMYGKTCLALVGDVGMLLGFAVAYAQRSILFPKNCDWLFGVLQDRMGESYVWYWPNVQVEDEGR